MNLDLEKILGTIPASDLIGRAREIDALLRHAARLNRSSALLLLSAPALGASEILCQTFDRLFLAQGETIPIYFSLKSSDKTAKKIALRFAQTFLQQTVAFQRNDARIFIPVTLG